MKNIYPVRSRLWIDRADAHALSVDLETLGSRVVTWESSPAEELRRRLHEVADTYPEIWEPR